jgi:hypothetical protein
MKRYDCVEEDNLIKRDKEFIAQVDEAVRIERAKDREEIAQLKENLKTLKERFVRKPYGTYWLCEYCRLTGWDHPRHERNCVFNIP